MIDGYEYQKRKKRELKEELKELKEKNKNPIDDLLVVIGIVIIVGFAFMFALFVMMANSIEESKNNCENIDGKYIVVDRQWSGKQMIDVYGCVK